MGINKNTTMQNNNNNKNKIKKNTSIFFSLIYVKKEKIFNLNKTKITHIINIFVAKNH